MTTSTQWEIHNLSGTIFMGDSASAVSNPTEGKILKTTSPWWWGKSWVSPGQGRSVLGCVGEGQCRWSQSCTGRPSWGTEQTSVNECSRGAEGISNCVLWERTLPEVINQRWGRISRFSAAQQACLHWHKWHSIECHERPACHSHTPLLYPQRNACVCTNKHINTIHS